MTRRRGQSSRLEHASKRRWIVRTMRGLSALDALSGGEGDYGRCRICQEEIPHPELVKKPLARICGWCEGIKLEKEREAQKLRERTSRILWHI